MFVTRIAFLDLWSRAFRLGLMGAALATLAACAGGDRPAAELAAEPSRARYDQLACWFAVQARRQVDCGALIVPENWDDADSRLIHLPVVVFRAQDRRSSREPIILLSGGPGGRPGIRNRAEIQQWLGVLQTAEWSHPRDVIMFAQRGTNWTDSDLSCPALEVSEDKLLGRMPEERLSDCARQLAGLHDLSGYNSVQNADDVLSLVQSMGLSEWSLYGVSYGSRFALTVMRRQPAGLQSVILDSVLPPSVNHLMPRSQPALEGALHSTFLACRREPLCREHFPDPEALYQAAMTRLERRPISLRAQGRTVEFDRSRLLAGLSDLLVTSEQGAIPGILESVAADTAADLWQAVYRNDSRRGSRHDLAVGAWMTIACNDGVGGAQVIADRDGGADLTPGEPELRDGAQCRDWPTFPVDAAGRAPVRSAVPTLLLAGELDPLTPPENARIAATTLVRSQVFVLPMAGHGVLWTQPCAARIVEAFLDQPARRPDVTCPAPAFDASASLMVRAAHLAVQNKLADAGKVLEQLLASQEMRDRGSLEVAVTLTLLGALYHDEGRLAPAASALEKTLAILGKAHGMNSVEAGAAAGLLADVYYDQARWAEALTMYRRALRAPEHERADPKFVRYERRERRLSTQLSG